MSKKRFLDDEEREFIEAYERGEYIETSASKDLKKKVKAAAKNYMQKNARINIRISEADLHGLKVRAVEEGMPYQTLIASVLHKFVSGRLA